MTQNISRPAALITGGAIRLGRQIAIHLAKSGWDIALHYNSSKKEAQKTQKWILSEGVACKIFSADFSKEEYPLEELIESTFKSFPHLKVLVNNASIYQESDFLDTSYELWKNHWNVNFRAPFFLSRFFAKRLLAKKPIDTSNISKNSPETLREDYRKMQSLKERSPSLDKFQPLILNILDNKIDFAQYEYATYILSKKALEEFSKIAAVELAPHIRVNGIALGVILPSPSRKQEYLQWRIDGIPLKKQGGVKNLTSAIDYLMMNDFITGQILRVDGGESIGFTGRSFRSFPSL